MRRKAVEGSDRGTARILRDAEGPAQVEAMPSQGVVPVGSRRLLRKSWRAEHIPESTKWVQQRVVGSEAQGYREFRVQGRKRKVNWLRGKNRQRE